MTPLRRYTNSSSFKMAVFFTVLLGIAVVMLAYMGNYFSRNTFVGGTESVIDTEMWYLTEQTPEKMLVVLNNPPPHRVYVLVDGTNKKIAGNLADLPQNVNVLSEGILLFDHGTPMRKFAAKILSFDDGRRLLVGVDITQTYHDNQVLRVLAIISILLMTVVILVSFLISTFVAQRTGSIAKTAQDIMDTGNLSQRIDVSSPWDDLSYMAQVLNALLERIEELMQNVSRVSDNIAHDLRTPLTRLRTRLESMRSELENKNDPYLIQLCDTIQSEADHLLTTFNALLRIAQIDTGKQKSNFRPVILHRVVEDVIELYEPLAEEKNITLDRVITPLTIPGDRDLLFQAFANLLDNAIKFTPNNGCITVALENNRLSVTDTGPGVLDADKEKVFQRFYRTEASRTTPGNGLGLSLVAAVVKLHGAAVTIRDANPGVRAEIRFDSLTEI